MKHFILVGLALALSVTAAVAQGRFPERPVTVVLPFPAGGPLDLIARLAQPKLAEVWGQPTILENRVGATGTIGTYSVVRAEPDGHTVLLTVDLPITMAPALFPTQYEPGKDLAIVGLFADTMQMIVAHPSLAVATMAQLIAKAKAEPGKIAFSSAGNGSPGHICGEMIKQTSGIDMLHVPYRGAAPATQAVLAGEVGLFCGPITQGAPQAKAGRLAALSVTGMARSALAPEVPTMAEQGIANFVVTNWYGVFAPAKTPGPVMATLRNGFQQAFAEPETRSRLAAAGIDTYWKDATEGAKMIEADLAKWGRVIKAGNIKAD